MGVGGCWRWRAIWAPIKMCARRTDQNPRTPIQNRVAASAYAKLERGFLAQDPCHGWVLWTLVGCSGSKCKKTGGQATKGVRCAQTSQFLGGEGGEDAHPDMPSGICNAGSIGISASGTACSLHLEVIHRARFVRSPGPPGPPKRSTLWTICSLLG